MRWELDTTLSVSEPIGADSQQQAVIDLVSGRNLVVGSAGSGKTTTLIATVAQRLREGVSPSEVLVLTYGKLAVRDFREELAGQVQSTVLPYIGTFHALAYSIVMGAGAIGPEPQAQELPRLLSGAEEDARIRDLIAGLLSDAQGPGALIQWPEWLRSAATTHSFAREVRTVIARLKELNQSGTDLLPTPFLVPHNEVTLNEWWEIDVSRYNIKVEGGRIEVDIFESFLPANCPPNYSLAISGWTISCDESSSGNSIQKGPTVSIPGKHEYLIRVEAKKL